MCSHWLVNTSSSALSSQRSQTLRFFPHEVKNIKQNRYFPQGLERLNHHENYPHTRETYVLSWPPREAVSFSHVNNSNQSTCDLCNCFKFTSNFKLEVNPNPPLDFQYILLLMYSSGSSFLPLRKMKFSATVRLCFRVLFYIALISIM
jgi:hypothetical protein